MAVATPLVVLCALCCGQLVIGSEGPGSPVSLVQSAVRVHGLSANGPAGQYLVDNSQLRHSGPGVLFRRSKDLKDVVSWGEYAKWGTTVEGQDSGDGWVSYGGYFLPVEIHGVRVMTPQSEEAPEKAEVVSNQSSANVSRAMSFRKLLGSAKAAGKRTFHRFVYKWVPTEYVTSNNVSQPCEIVGPGSKPDTYNIYVKPKSFSPYNVTNVPKASLRKVEKVKQFIATPKAPKFVTKEVDESKSTIKLSINFTNDKTVMDLKIMKKSPMRTIMKMACERSKISWHKCQRFVTFTHKGTSITQDAHVDELKLMDGETIIMTKTP